VQLKLKNIGMIKEADVNIDGLTVIAGENDTGKSTVAKALFLLYHDMALNSDIDKYGNAIIGKYKNSIYPQAEKIKKSIFSENSITKKSSIELVKDNKFHKFHHYGNLYRKDIKIANIAFVETPLVWNMQDFFRKLSDLESHLKQIGESIDIPYPYLLKDLYFKLSTKSDYEEVWTKSFSSKISSIINGDFKIDDKGIFRFHRDKSRFKLEDVATGIKTFGALQVLLNNNRLTTYSLLILDEPEVHLHPKWQLKMAELIVKLVKNGVKIVVNSHSPYMIEALQKYGEIDKIDSNFYLAEDGYIKQIDGDNSKTLVEIYEKLSEPYDIFEELESDRMENMLNG
jgi:predicted ATPase